MKTFVVVLTSQLFVLQSFAENTMNELLGWYGYDKVELRDSDNLEIGETPQHISVLKGMKLQHTLRHFAGVSFLFKAPYSKLKTCILCLACMLYYPLGDHVLDKKIMKLVQILRAHEWMMLTHDCDT